MRLSISLSRWLQIAVVCGITAALVASVTPSAGAAAQTTHKHHHKRHHHHRRHHKKKSKVKAAQQSRAVVPQQCANADTPATPDNAVIMRAAVVCLINQQRVLHGLPIFKVSTKLNRSAQNWNDWMVGSGQFTHGNNFAGRISAVGYDWQTAGENIATGFPTPRTAVQAWMASPDHCRNILDPSFRDIGTGVTDAAVGNWATQPSTWTNDFGLLMSQNAPSHNSGPQAGCPY
ncbi:MAG TPA: CAP domain-containing protein [Solirubrobacteraceae bacterium]|nr:CAP domain-containing protein [Solirubrobacteraceae bacterium]